MQSIAIYTTDEDVPSIQCCIDILNTLISRINSFVDSLKTVTININIETAPISYQAAKTRFCETVSMYNTLLKAMAQHLRRSHPDNVAKATCANELHMMCINLMQTIHLLEYHV